MVISMGKLHVAAEFLQANWMVKPAAILLPEAFQDTPGFSFMCVLAEGFSMPLVVETLSTLAPGEWMSVVTMGLVTTAFCLWAEACALQNVDASVVAWHRKSGPP